MWGESLGGFKVLGLPRLCFPPCGSCSAHAHLRMGHLHGCHCCVCESSRMQAHCLSHYLLSYSGRKLELEVGLDLNPGILLLGIGILTSGPNACLCCEFW